MGRAGPALPDAEHLLRLLVRLLLRALARLPAPRRPRAPRPSRPPTGSPAGRPRRHAAPGAAARRGRPRGRRRRSRRRPRCPEARRTARRRRSSPPRPRPRRPPRRPPPRRGRSPRARGWRAEPSAADAQSQAAGLVLLRELRRDAARGSCAAAVLLMQLRGSLGAGAGEARGRGGPLGVARVEDDRAAVLHGQVVEQQPLGAALVKLGRRLMEERVDVEGHLELLEAEVRRLDPRNAGCHALAHLLLLLLGHPVLPQWRLPLPPSSSSSPCPSRLLVRLSPPISLNVSV